jgi:hypothetical protein
MPLLVLVIVVVVAASMQTNFQRSPAAAMRAHQCALVILITCHGESDSLAYTALKY